MGITVILLLRVKYIIHHSPAECNDSFRSIKSSVYIETRKATTPLCPTVYRRFIEEDERVKVKACEFAQMGYESEIESDFGKIEFSPQLSSLRPLPSLFHPLLSFCIQKSSQRSTMSDDETHNQTFEQVSIHIPSFPFSFRSHPAFSRPVPGPPSPSPCNARHSARTATSSLRVCGYFWRKWN